MNDNETEKLPPFYKTLKNYARKKAALWSTPGHASGRGMQATPAGKDFYEFYGRNLFLSDLSSSVADLGSILEHEGPAGEAERQAAEIFGAQTTFFVLNGTSTANKIVFFATVAPNDVVLVDRNCHKSIMHAIIMNEAIPIYLRPKPSSYGLLGPIGLEEMTPQAVKEKVQHSKWVRNKKASKVQLAVLTNSTYDGVIYNADKIKSLLANQTHFLLFDEAWFAYAAFHPFYDGRYAMSPFQKKRGVHMPAVFATQSTHKMLLAFSQGSMLHFKQGTGKQELDPQGLVEANLMHASTSPFYPLFASLDVSARIMRDRGYELINKALDQAIRFRHVVRLAGERYRKSGTWWFTPWQPPRKRLEKDPAQWKMQPGASWTGTAVNEEDDLLLDPLKVTLLTPGVRADASMEEEGIPAAVVRKFLERKNIVPEKIGFYNLLFLFAPGVSIDRSRELLQALHAFKTAYDENEPLQDVFPDLVAQHPDFYRPEEGLKDLCARLHRFLKKRQIMKTVSSLYSTLPEQALLPHKAYYGLVEGKTEYVPLSEAAGRVSVFMILPYPPGVPLIMPGERFPSEGGEILGFLQISQDFDNLFPGFETEFHGIKKVYENGQTVYMINCLKKIKDISFRMDRHPSAPPEETLETPEQAPSSNGAGPAD